MWELLTKLSHGRISARRFSLLVMTAIMTFFVATFALAPAAHADEAARDGANLTYNGNTYTPVAADGIPKDITSQAPNAEGYRYIDTAAGKAHFILTSGTAGQANSGYYVIYDFTPPANYSNGSPPTDVTITGGATDDPAATDEDEEVSACDGSTLGGIGWIVCPAVNFIAKGMDKIYMIISDFLVVKTVAADTNSPLYQLWMVIRDIANICFVIALLIIIYSQLTSIGISNYGIKNTLPRLVIAAILVNISYWICAVAVDASNILGYAIHGLFVGIMDKFSVGANYSGIIPTWEQVAAVALAGTGAVAAGVFILSTSVSGSVFLLIPLLVSAICAALVALLVLATRQALITIFIIISPLAFVAYVLPNTEKWFTKWRETFTTLLLLFPIFSVIFSGAQLAGMAIVQSAGGNLFTIILGLAVQVAPIVVTPMLVKFSGSIIGRVAGMLNNPNKGIVDRTRNWAQGAAAERKNKVLTNQTRLGRSRFGALTRNPLTGGTKAINNYRRRVEGRRKAYEGMADNAFAATKYGQNIEAMNRENANEKQSIDNRFADSARGRRLELQSRNLGVEKQEIENSLLRSDGGKQLTYRQSMAEVDKSRVHNEFEESHLGHQADRAKRTVEMEKKRIENTHQADWDTALRTDAGLLNLELSVKGSELKANAAKVKLDKMHAEIAAQGSSSEHILNLRGVDMQDQAGLLNIAHDINRSQVEATLAGMAKNAAEHKLSSTTNEVLLKNSIQIEGVDARKYAAGISSEAATLASAVAKERKEFAEDVSYQKELASHFKLNAGQIEALAMAKGDVTVTDDHGNAHTFSINDEHARDMAAEEIFTVGSHGQKMAVLKTTGAGGINFENRRTIQQAAIKSGIGSIAPAINDKTLDDIINGKFLGDESWQYHSFREVLEGRIKAQTLSTANAASLELLFADVGSSALTQTQFDRLINDGVADELRALRVANPGATDADARASLTNKFNAERDNMRKMAKQVLDTPTIRQNANAQSLEVLEKFAR